MTRAIGMWGRDVLRAWDGRTSRYGLRTVASGPLTLQALVIDPAEPQAGVEGPNLKGEHMLGFHAFERRAWTFPIVGKETTRRINENRLSSAINPGTFSLASKLLRPPFIRWGRTTRRRQDIRKLPPRRRRRPRQSSHIPMRRLGRVPTSGLKCDDGPTKPAPIEMPRSAPLKHLPRR
jgi:hypothetical protein